MSNDFSDGLLMKGKGNQLFVSNDYKEAILRYEDAIVLFDKSDHPDASKCQRYVQIWQSVIYVYKSTPQLRRQLLWQYQMMNIM